MGEDTSSLLEVADMELVEEGDHGMDDEKGEATGQVQVQVQKREQARRDADGELVGVVAEGSVQVVEEVGNGRTHRVDSNRMEGDHSFHIDSEGVEGHTWQAGRVVGCDNGAKVAGVVHYVHTNNCRDDRTGCDQRVVGPGKLGSPVVAAEVAGSELEGLFREGVVGWPE